MQEWKLELPDRVVLHHSRPDDPIVANLLARDDCATIEMEGLREAHDRERVLRAHLNRHCKAIEESDLHHYEEEENCNYYLFSGKIIT